ncbi:hypothetical protein KT99_19939 [Shewanella benthica KT99]|uniref:Uncharacterized protein n=1 Tax=Shewanella benthica KT99 TaxID=314608 RepID=A9D0F2_9GAMM|nr:hypothetical protein KT99_19939 [Shewanella benthica KT99]
MQVSMGEWVRFKLMLAGGYLSIEIIDYNKAEL